MSPEATVEHLALTQADLHPFRGVPAVCIEPEVRKFPRCGLCSHALTPLSAWQFGRTRPSHPRTELASLPSVCGRASLISPTVIHTVAAATPRRCLRCLACIGHFSVSLNQVILYPSPRRTYGRGQVMVRGRSLGRSLPHPLPRPPPAVHLPRSSVLVSRISVPCG